VAGEANHLVVFAFILLLAEVVVVKPFILICLCLTILGCTSNGVDYRDFAVDTYFPSPNEIQLAEARARNYWGRNGARFGPEPRYLAVETSKLFGPYPGLYPKLINSETTATFLARVDESNPYSELVLKGVMIFDTKTGHVVGSQGYVSVDTPSPGQVARFGDFMARWIGTGGSSLF
jgi:hypothetical protein